MRVELAAVVIEAVGELVTDGAADRAEVYRLIHRWIEEWRLQDPGGEHDLDQRAALVAIDILRKRKPLVAVYRPTDLRYLARPLEAARSDGIAEDVTAQDIQPTVVPPAVRMADLDAKGCELVQCFLACRVGHPWQC